MNTQVNVRLPEEFLSKAEKYASKNGFGNVQELIKEALREKIFSEVSLPKEEIMLVKKLLKVSRERNLFGTEEELFKKLKKK